MRFYRFAGPPGGPAHVCCGRGRQARGLIAARDSSLLLLDEPTSSVDLATESVIFDRLLPAFSAKAIVASIHRLHLLPRFDTVVLMADGRIADVGGLSELLARRPEFRTLWENYTATTRRESEMADA